MHPDLEKLKVHVDKLHFLLNEAQDGFWTWNQFMKNEWDAIIKLAGIDPEE